MSTPAITMMNNMASKDIEESIRYQAEKGLSQLDLKNHVYGRNIGALDDGQVEKLEGVIDKHGMQLYCLSTELMSGYVEDGEAHFSKGFAQVDRIAKVARRLEPKMIRIQAVDTRVHDSEPTIEQIVQRHAWLVRLYRELSQELVTATGCKVTIENTPGTCILRTEAHVKDFFDHLDMGAEVGFTWDVQNMWECGRFPDANMVDTLARDINYIHVKGGAVAESGSQELAWKSTLQDASWDVQGVLSRVIGAGRVAAISLNPSHGRTPAGYDIKESIAKDIDFLLGLTFSGITDMSD